MHFSYVHPQHPKEIQSSVEYLYPSSSQIPYLLSILPKSEVLYSVGERFN